MLYGLASAPFGRLTVVMVRPLLTVIERTAVAVCAGLLESDACTVKVVVPDPVGVPPITPTALIVRPAGNTLPLASENVYDGTPPVAETLTLYGEPCIPFTKVVVVIERAGVTVIERFAVTVCGVGLESFTCTVKFVVPCAVGLPVMAPVALIVNPADNTVPLASENVSGRLPPVAVTVAL